MNKNEIRKEILQKRKNLSKNFVQKNSEIILKKICEYINQYNFNNIMIFMDMENEVNISKILNFYPDRNFYIPKTFADGTMKINKYNANELFLHKFGYFESKSELYEDETILDLIIVPGVVFDKAKNRIGFGKGYYDRFLTDLSKKINSQSNIEKSDNIEFHNKKSHNFKMPLTIAVCYDFQILDTIPSEKHDIKPDIVISESLTLK